MRNKTIAILLAFFLGALGIHKFYLGNNIAGVIYLLFSWTFIPALLAFFDFIGLIMTSDAVFDAKYNGGKSSQVIIGSQESSRDKAATLNELKKLYDNGIITAQEYEEKRRKLLDSI